MENNISEMNMKQIKRELRLTRIFCGISSILVICLLVVVVMLMDRLRPVYEFIQEAEPVVEQLSRFDVETFNDTLEQVDTTLESVDWEQVSESLKQLNVEAINHLIEGIDPEEFSTAIENLNKAAATMESISERFSSVSGFFGR